MKKKYFNQINLFLLIFLPPGAAVQGYASVLEELDLEEDFKVGQVDIDEYPELVSKYRIMSVPFFIVFKNGEVAGKTIGVQSKEELLALIRG